MKNATTSVTKLCLASMFVALGWLMPFLSGQNIQMGNMLCLMHIPILVGGLLLGEKYGFVIGAVTPLTRCLLFGRPAFYPTALCMAFELAAYGFISGLLFRSLKKKQAMNDVAAIYISLIAAMLFGRVIWGVSRAVCGVVSQNAFTWKMFLTAGFVTAIPGILIQLLLIPAVILTINRVMAHDSMQ